MVGRELTDRFPKRPRCTSTEPILEVNDWCVHHPIYTEKQVVSHVSFHVNRGEIIGFSGLQGAGRTELAGPSSATATAPASPASSKSTAGKFT